MVEFVADRCALEKVRNKKSRHTYEYRLFVEHTLSLIANYTGFVITLSYSGWKAVSLSIIVLLPKPFVLNKVPN